VRVLAGRHHASPDPCCAAGYAADRRLSPQRGRGFDPTGTERVFVGPSPRAPGGGAVTPRKAPSMRLVDERQRRLVTTNAGRLPRPASLSAMLFARMTRQSYDAAAFPGELRAAVAAVVKQQSDLGVDVVSDGEFSKISFQYYVTDRLGGIEPITPTTGHR